MKRVNLFLTLIIIVSMIISVPCRAAEAGESDYGRDIEMLQALGIVEEAVFTADESITREQATVMVMRLVGYTAQMAEYNNEFIDVDSQNPNAGLLKLAVNLGIAKRVRTNPSAFAPEGKVSYNDAGKMILNALGYVFLEGGTQYLTKLNSLGNGIAFKDTDALTKGEMARLVLNAGQMPVVRQSVFGEKAGHELVEDVTALSVYHDIHVVEGIVTANMHTGLYERTPAKEDHIEIDGISVRCEGDFDVHEMLGKDITAFCKLEKGEKIPVLICYEYTENNKLETIESDDIISYANRTYKYYSADGKSDKIEISRDSTIIYNSVVLSDDMLSDTGLFTPENGYVEFIKSGNSGDYDIIKIFDYKTYVVQGIDRENQIIIDMYNEPPIKIDEDASITISDAKGSAIGFDKIDKWNVLSIAESADKSVVNIIACGEVVQGVLKSIDLEDGIFVEGEFFELTSSLKENIKSELVKVPHLGENILVYLDYTGKAVAIEKSTDSVWKIGYLVDVGTKGGLDSEVQYKLLSQDGKITLGAFAENLKVDNESYKNKDHNVLLDYIPENGTLIRYRLNKDGNIYQMDTPQTGAGGIEDCLVLTNACKGSIRSYVPCFLMEDKNMLLVNPNAVAFEIPVESGADEKDYKAGTLTGIFTTSDDTYYYDIETYKFTSDAIAEEVVISKSAAGSEMPERALTTVIESISKVLNAEGEEVEKITGVNTSGRRQWTFDEDGSNIIKEKNLKPGDIVRIAADEDGVIGMVQKVFDYESRTVHADMNGVNPSSVFDSVYRVSYGKALQRKDGFIQLQLHNELQTLETYKDDGVALIYEDGIVTRGTRDDIIFDKTGEMSSDVVMDLCWLNTRCIVIYR